MKAIREAISLIPAPWEADTGRSHRWVPGQPSLQKPCLWNKKWTNKKRERKKAHEKYVFTIKRNEISLQGVGYNQPKRQRIPWLFILH